MRLYSFGLDIKVLPERETEKVNYNGDHISLKFQNPTASATLIIEDIALGVVVIPER